MTFAPSSRNSSVDRTQRPHTSHTPSYSHPPSTPPPISISNSDEPLPAPKPRDSDAKSTEARTPHKQGPAGTTVALPKPAVHGTAPDGDGLSSITRSRTESVTLPPSKLSAASLPVSPIGDNARPATSAGPSTSGFFSSVISVAQNAATTISNSIAQNSSPSNPGGRPKSSSSQLAGDQPGAAVRPALMDLKDSAVRTLGTGELSLSALGFSDPAAAEETTPIATKFSGNADSRPWSETGDALPAGSQSDPGSEDITSARRPNDPTADFSPAGSLYEEKVGTFRRTGSVRSALGRRSRNRGESNTTGGGSLASSSNLNLSAPAAGLSSAAGSKLAGFAIASKKRNRDFHTLFKSVPDDDYLIEDYSCALQREILAHGRLYVSEGHLCFSSNIFGWVTTLVMSFGEIVSVEKRSTALVFKNGLMITTLHAKHVFASFTSRDATYDLIVNIWKLGHPSLMSSLNGVRMEGTGGDKTEKVDAPAAASAAAALQNGEDLVASGTEEDDSDGEDVYDEDEDDGHLPDPTLAADASAVAEAENDKSGSRKVSGNVSLGAGQGDQANEPFPTATTAGAGPGFPGPATHAPTDCGDAASHYDKVVGDDIIPAPLGQVYNLIFGPESNAFMSKWLQGEQKCFDLQMEDKKGLTLDNTSRAFNYIKPLGGSIGPKQTKCVIVETLSSLDLEKAVNVSVQTSTPDVPSGNVFSIQTKYCLSWAENNSTRFQANCAIEWTAKSWLKGTWV